MIVQRKVLMSSLPPSRGYIADAMPRGAWTPRDPPRPPPPPPQKGGGGSLDYINPYTYPKKPLRGVDFWSFLAHFWGVVFYPPLQLRVKPNRKKL